MGCLRSWLCYVILTIAARTARTYRYETRRCWGRKEWRYTATPMLEVIGLRGAWVAWWLARCLSEWCERRGSGTLQAGRYVIALLLVLGVATVDAGGEESSERSMLFNTRGLAVSTAAAAAASATFFFAQAALSKLAFIAQAIEEKSIDFGALVELICDRKQARLLVQWFRSRGFGLVVATGERCHEKRTTRNSVAVFYRLRKYKPVKGQDVGKYRACSTDRSPNAATRLGQRILRMALRRRDMSTFNVVAWHGCHGEPEFGRQMDVIEGLAAAGSNAVILGDVNRRADECQASKAGALGIGDRRWKALVGWGSDGVRDASERLGQARLVPLLDESEAAATRRATVGGENQWAVLDRMVETGEERLRWQLDEIVWAEQA